MLAPGTVLAGRYEIVRQLGAGGMGDIYEARQRDLSRKVAIKTLQGAIAADAESFARFRREAEAAAALGHPNIVQVLDFRAEPHEPAFIVLEMLEGRTLHQAIHEDGPMTPQRACFIARQILSALAAAHAAGIVHRDIKPANVFLVKTIALPDFVKVLDFGIARVENAPGRPITQLGDVLGTTAYMAPEQARGAQVDFRADIFSVAAVLFHMLAGAPPRQIGPTDIHAAATLPCRRLKELRPTIEPGLGAIVDLALSLDPPMRPTAEKMAAALEPFGGGVTGPGDEFGETVRDAPEKVPVTQAVAARPPAPAPSANPMYPAPISPPMSPPMSPVYVSAPPPAPMQHAVATARRKSDRNVVVLVVVFVVGSVVAVAIALLFLHQWADGTIESHNVAFAQRGAKKPCSAKCVAVPNYDAARFCAAGAVPREVGDFVWARHGDDKPRAVRVVASEPGGFTVIDANNATKSVPLNEILGAPCP